jgi:REP element-mobilizing transposase RayT
MAGSFSQIYIQVIFAVKSRESQVQSLWEEELYRYITGIVQNKEQKMLAINGMPDHIHFLIGMRPSCCLADLVREVKKASNIFINDKRLVPGHFQWQEGYGAFSYSHSSLDHVIAYIGRQKEHH